MTFNELEEGGLLFVYRRKDRTISSETITEKRERSAACLVELVTDRGSFLLCPRASKGYADGSIIAASADDLKTELARHLNDITEKAKNLQDEAAKVAELIKGL